MFSSLQLTNGAGTANNCGCLSTMTQNLWTSQPATGHDQWLAGKVQSQTLWMKPTFLTNTIGSSNQMQLSKKGLWGIQNKPCQKNLHGLGRLTQTNLKLEHFPFSRSRACNELQMKKSCKQISCVQPMLCCRASQTLHHQQFPTVFSPPKLFGRFSHERPLQKVIYLITGCSISTITFSTSAAL